MLVVNLPVEANINAVMRAAGIKIVDEDAADARLLSIMRFGGRGGVLSLFTRGSRLGRCVQPQPSVSALSRVASSPLGHASTEPFAVLRLSRNVPSCGARRSVAPSCHVSSFLTSLLGKTETLTPHAQGAGREHEARGEHDI